MAIKNGIRSLLMSEPTVMSLLASQSVDAGTVEKVFVSTADQGVQTPYVIVSLTGYDPMKTLTETTGMRQSEIDVDCFGSTPAEADELADAVEDYLKDYVGGAGTKDYIDAVLLDDRNDFENSEGDGNDSWRYAVTLSFTMFHHPL